MSKLKIQTIFILIVSQFYGSSSGMAQITNTNKADEQALTFTSKKTWLTKTQNSNKFQNVHCLIQDKGGNIWIGTTGEGVYRYDGKVFKQITKKDGLSNNIVWSIMEDSFGNIWFGSGPMASEGIVFYNGRALSNFKPKNEGWIRKITDDRNGNLLFATRHNGILLYDGKIFNIFFEPPQLRKDLINTILRDKEGTIWYAYDFTDNQDIYKGGFWNFNEKSFHEFAKKDGLANISIFSLLEDQAGNIWIGTRNCGLFRFNGKKINRYTD